MLTNSKPVTVIISLYGTENAGCRYISSALRRSGYPCHLIFLKEWRNNDLSRPTGKEIKLLLSHLREISPSIVGISLISSFLPVARELTGLIQDELKIPVIWGGIHPTAFPEECLESADFICQGEAEETLPELLRRLENEESLSGLRGIGYRQGKEVFINPVRPLIQDLDTLPLPDLDNDNKVLIDNDRIIPGEPIRAGAEYRIYISRGCPFSCSYCYNSILRRMYRGMGRYYRFRSVEHVMRELEMAKKLLPHLRRVKIDDDTAFCYGEKWLDEFCEQYPERIGVPFECLIHPGLLRRKFLEKLKSAGLIKIQVGIESGSSRELESDFHRKGAYDKIKQFAEWNRDLKIEVVYDVIIDNPVATEKDKIDQVEYLLDLKRPFKIYLYSLTHFPGTELTMKLVKKGIIKPSEVEGKATKAWRQFRVDFSYPRSPRDRFYLSLLVLASHPWIPRSFLRCLLKSEFLKKHPGPLWYFMIISNTIRMIGVAFQMLFRGELTIFKIRQYGRFSRMISQ